MRQSVLVLISVVVLKLAAASSTVCAAEEWERIFNASIVSEYSKERQDALRQIDTTTPKGLKTIWRFLDKIAPRDPLKFDWFVKEGAFEALMNATGEECDTEFLRVLKTKGYENSKEAIVHSVIWRIRKNFEKEHGENDDNKIAEAKFFLRKKRGVNYFKLVLPTIQKIDPDAKMLGWIRLAFADKSTKVRLAGLHGLTAYPDNGSIPLLLDHMKSIEKRKTKMFKEWVFTRHALETLSGQYFRDEVDDWFQWWAIVKDRFDIKKRVEEEASDDEDGGTKGKTTVVQTGGVQVTVHMKVAGLEDGYPLLVLPKPGFEPDYFRPYFHGIEEFARVYYIQMPQIDDFKGLKRDAATNLIIYPTETVSQAVAEIMKESGPEKFAVLGHGPASGLQAMSVAAKFPKQVSHLLLINPASAGARYRSRLDSVKQAGRARKSNELVHGVENLLLGQDNRPSYEPADAAEAGGLGRALNNVKYADPSSAEVGAMQFFYRLPGGKQTLNDRNWSVGKVFGNKAPSRLPVMIVQGERDPWTPAGDMGRVGAFFKGTYVSKFKSTCQHMFIFDPYRFTREVQGWLKKKGVKMPAKKKKKRSSKSGRTTTK